MSFNIISLSGFFRTVTRMDSIVHSAVQQGMQIERRSSRHMNSIHHAIRITETHALEKCTKKCYFYKPRQIYCPVNVFPMKEVCEKTSIFS